MQAHHLSATLLASPLFFRLEDCCTMRCLAFDTSSSFKRGGRVKPTCSMPAGALQTGTKSSKPMWSEVVRVLIRSESRLQRRSGAQ